LKIILCGHKHHGKSTVGKAIEAEFGLRCFSSSHVARYQVYDNSKVLQRKYQTADHAWQEKDNDRAEWYKQIQRLNTPDKTYLAELLFDMPHAAIYDGMRCITELEACRDKWYELLVIWVWNPFNKVSESSESNTIQPWHCDFILPNAGNLPQLCNDVRRKFGLILGVGV